jgi:hypothetical protein
MHYDPLNRLVPAAQFITLLRLHRYGKALRALQRAWAATALPGKARGANHPANPTGSP